MKDTPDQPALLRPHTILDKLKVYSRQAGKLGRRVRALVFGFRLRSTVDVDRGSLPAKVDRHRIVQRQRAFKQGGGTESGVARHALEKVRHYRPRW